MDKNNRNDYQNKKESKNEDHEFSEELADGGERNEVIEKQVKPTRGVRLI